MKAIVQHRYGGPEVLRLVDVAPAIPARDQVLVRVRAASVNARDWHFLRGDPYLARLAAPELGLRGPKVTVRGTDFAGTVEAVGAGVDHLRPGDDVYGEANGAFAEFVCAPAGVVAAMPGNLSYEQAAAVPLAANTALIGLRDLAGVRGGQRVLINGSSGGVGTFAVQLAKAYGAEVTAVCGPRNLELVESLGADHVVDYTRDDFARHRGRYDVLLDLVGNRSLADLRRATAPQGTVLLSGGGVSRGGSLFGPMGLMMRGTAVGRFVRQRVLVLTAVPSAANLAALTGLLESGRLTPIVERTYPLAEAAAAIRRLEVEHARAKIVLRVDTDG
ncbi:NAD(P)-dependent alcohol dehydrogenase [Micromonospora zhanjiangensis]|uniref:NAD(P)-dependent alcohol dehydrogenase n=1 Tax=Micromonospora zhanjiangensis TaxID=1522057 RepID=A0ABV8KQ09_9ACTN